jgi:hypothetical protein
VKNDKSTTEPHCEKHGTDVYYIFDEIKWNAGNMEEDTYIVEQLVIEGEHDKVARKRGGNRVD